MTGEDRKLAKLKNSYRKYYKNYSVQFTLGLIWMLSSYIGKFDIQLSILTMLLGISLFKPALYIITRFLGVRKIHKDENLVHLIKIITIGILFGMIVGFFPFIENINYFFPTFAIIFGLIFACIAYTNKLLNFGILATILTIGSLYLGYTYENEFTYTGFFSGIVLLGFGLLNWIAGKRTQIVFRLLNKKVKSRWKETLIYQANQRIAVSGKEIYATSIRKQPVAKNKIALQGR